MDEIKNKIQTCRNLIEISNTDNALKTILEIINEIEFEKTEALLLSSRWQGLTQNLIKNFISSKEFESERYEINKSVLLFLERVEKYIENNSNAHLKILAKQMEAERRVFNSLSEAAKKSSNSTFFESLLGGFSSSDRKLDNYILNIEFDDCSEEFRTVFKEMRRLIREFSLRRQKMDNWNPFVKAGALFDILSGDHTDLNEKINNCNDELLIIQHKEKIIAEQKEKGKTEPS